jgi:hypothetical protein
MRRTVASLLLGALAGALSAFSHGVAGGPVGLVPLLVIVVVSGIAFAVLPRRMRGPGGIVSLLIAIQLVAHLWLEAVHPHQHGGSAGSQAHGSHGIAGAIEHALTPGMLMMWSHLVAVIVGAILILAIRPLLESLLGHVASWLTPATGLVSAPTFATTSSWTSARSCRLTMLTHIIEGRGPPVAV